jgi:hypothetical protein
MALSVYETFGLISTSLAIYFFMYALSTGYAASKVSPADKLNMAMHIVYTVASAAAGTTAAVGANELMKM